MNKASYKAEFPRFIEKTLFKFFNQNQELDFSLQKTPLAFDQPIKNTYDSDYKDRQLVYFDILGNDINILLNTANEALVKEVVIENQEALTGLAKDDYYYNIPFTLSSNKNIDIIVDGKKLSEEKLIESDQLAEIRDETGISSYIWPPTARDSSWGGVNAINIKIEYRLTDEGIIITKKIPSDWLKNAFFPVTTDATISYYDGTGDGRVQVNNLYETWSSQRSRSAANTVTYTLAQDMMAGAVKDGTTDDRFIIVRGFMPFDTSGIPDDASIDSAKLFLYPYFLHPSMNIGLVQTTQASVNSLILDDYDQCGTVDSPVEGADRVSAWSTSAYGHFDLNSDGLSWINKTGYTRLGIREAHDIDNSAPANNTFYGAAFHSSEQPGTDKDPYLEVTYTENNSSPTSTIEYGAKVENGDFIKYNYVNEDHWEAFDKNGTVYIRKGHYHKARRSE